MQQCFRRRNGCAAYPGYLLFTTVVAIVLVTVTAAPPQMSPWCQDPNHPAEVGMYGDLGFVDLVDNHDLPRTPDNTTALLFRQGLAHLYGFNNVEANRNFQTAADQSPDCALCFWGIAMAFAPNINYVIENQTTLNYAANMASALAAKQPQLSNKTRTLIAATARLVAPEGHVDSPNSTYRQAFADELCSSSLGNAYESDADIDTFCAGALMALSPWNYYEGLESGKVYPMKSFLLPAKQKLLEAVKRGPIAPGSPSTIRPHVFATHLLIHLLEPSNAPPNYRWEALDPTLVLFNGSAVSTGQEVVPAQGHLTHMPAHLFLRVGLFNEAVSTSVVCTGDNAKYFDMCLNPYAWGHNLKMLVANARLAGRLRDALQAATAALKPAAEYERTPNGAPTCVDCAGPASPEKILTLVRFAQWKEVLEQPLPVPGSGNGTWGPVVFAAYHEAAWRYARAAAYWALGTVPSKAINKTLVSLGDAEAELSRKAAARAAFETMNYTIIIPEQLSGIRALRVDRNWSAAILHYRNVVAADDHNMYMEPPRMSYPPRHCLGALLNAAPLARNTTGTGTGTGTSAPEYQVGGNHTAALEYFQQDLEAYVGNAWSLFGAADAASALGMHNLSTTYRAQAEAAWQNADVKFVSPCPQLFG